MASVNGCIDIATVFSTDDTQQEILGENRGEEHVCHNEEESDGLGVHEVPACMGLGLTVHNSAVGLVSRYMRTSG